MTETEQRIALAMDNGWQWYRRPGTGPWAKNPMRALYHPGIQPEYTATLQPADMTERQCNEVFLWREGSIPDYLHDLNVAQPLINQLAHGERLLWLEQMDIVTLRWSQDWFPGRIATAPASEWCEALLRVKGLWKE